MSFNDEIINVLLSLEKNHVNRAMECYIYNIIK